LKQAILVREGMVKEAVAKEGYESWKTYKDDMKEGTKKWLLAGWKLKQIRDTRAYSIDGYADFKAFLLAETIEAEKELKSELVLYRKQKPHEMVESATFTVRSSAPAIKLIKKGLKEIIRLEKKDIANVLVDLIQERLDSEGKAIKSNEAEINRLSRQFVDMFCQKHQEYRRSKYMVFQVKNKKLCNTLVGTFNLPELEKALDRFFTIKGKRKWWNNYSISVFYTAINDLVGEDVNIEDKYTTAIRKELAERDLTKISTEKLFDLLIKYAEVLRQEETTLTFTDKDISLDFSKKITWTG